MTGITITANTTKPTRVYSELKPGWQRYQASSNNTNDNLYQRQYSHVYHQRLTELSPRIWERINADTDNNTGIKHVHRILELEEDIKSAIVGTCVQDKNEYYLEDESGRVSLLFSNNDDDRNHNKYCTGVVLGVIGTVQTDGTLQVESVYTVNTVTNPTKPMTTTDTATSNSNKVLFISGLECGNPEVSSLSRDMLLSYIHGVLNDEAKDVSHVIVAGGLIHPDSTRDGCLELDGFLKQCGSTVPITILPGQNDPTTANWPQRPLHRSLVPQSSNNSNTDLLYRTPNPCAMTIQGMSILGSNGYNIQDLSTKLNNVNEIKCMEYTLEYGHICPTGPDTIPTIPHLNTDPMVINTLPQIYFSGNCKTFDTKLVQINNNNNEYCRIICIPKFITTGIACLVDLNTLNVELLRFE